MDDLEKRILLAGISSLGMHVLKSIDHSVRDIGSIFMNQMSTDKALGLITSIKDELEEIECLISKRMQLNEPPQN